MTGSARVEPARSARYELLDPLRGLAILAVMLLHFCERGRHSGDSVIHGTLWPVIQHGYLGVQLFFVISGYCITAAVYSAMKRSHSFRYFMTRRLRRIFPPYWASMLLVIVLGLATIAVLKTPTETVFPLSPFDWLCNVFLVQGPLHAKDANLVYWSLSIEIQFYLVMSLSLLWSGKLVEVWLFAVSAAFLAVDHLTTWPLWGTVIVYWSEFLCGIIVYYWLTGRMAWRWTPAVLLGFVVLDIALQAPQYQVMMQPNGRVIQPVKLIFCLGCMLAMLGLRRYDDAICARRSVKLLAWFGLISYSLYLCHVPVGTRVFNLADRVTGLGGLKWLPCAIAAMVVSTAFGWVFFRVFEKPWLNPSASTASAPAKTLQERIAT
ncbi:MAG: acyltransferase [Fuerstiella sp.]